MPRKYIRKTQRGADGERYTAQALKRAINDVKSGSKTIKGAATTYNIPRTTLRHNLAGTRGVKGLTAKGGSGGGCKLALDKNDEESLVVCLKTMERWGFGLTREEVLDIVQMYVTNNNIKTRFKNGRPGEDWYLSFSKRHNLSIKKPQGVEYTRMGQINPFVIYGFYDILSKTMEELNLCNKPHLIYNLDESSFCHDPSKLKIVGARGVKSTRMISSPGRENTSALICCSAAGEKMPPLVIFKGKNIIENWLNVNEADKTFYAASKRGWMETSIFTNWFKKCFLPSLSEERPILLLYDGHSSHISPELIETAVEHQITIIKLPPHTTHVLQPLDVAVFKSLKNGWEKELVKWQRSNPRQRIPKPKFVEILNRVYDNMSADIIINGFKATGIYDEDCARNKRNPVNRHVIRQEIFRPEDLKEYKRKLEEKAKVDTITAEGNEILQSNNYDDIINEMCLNGDNLEANRVEIVQEDEDPGEEVQGMALTSRVEIMQAENLETIKEVASTSNSNPTTEAPSIIEITEEEPAALARSFEDILLNFIRSSKNNTPAKTTKRRICNNAEIVTSAEYLAKIKEDEEKKKQTTLLKEEKKKAALKRKLEKEQVAKQKKKKLVVSSSSSESSVESFSSSSDSDNDEVEQDIAIIVEDYVIVIYDAKHYPAQVINIEDKDVTVKHMMKCGKLDGWKWPMKPDVLTYKLNEVYKIISPPVPVNKRGLYSVPEMEVFKDEWY